MEGAIKRAKLGIWRSRIKNFGWKQSGLDKFVANMQNALISYDITNKDSIRMLFATMAAESDYGRITLEEGSDAYFKNNGYSRNTRGAGYIQLTFSSTHKAFLNSVGARNYGSDTASYIAKNYAELSAAWFWAKMSKTGKGNLNAYVKAYGGSVNIFLITQCFVLGHFPGDLSDDLAKLRAGNTTFSVSNGKLKINGHTHDLPSNWSKRKAAYDKAKSKLCI